MDEMVAGGGERDCRCSGILEVDSSLYFNVIETGIGGALWLKPSAKSCVVMHLDKTELLTEFELD